MRTAKEKFYDDLRIAWWIGFGHVFGWAGYKIHRLDAEFWSSHLEALPNGLLFFLILAFLHTILYAIRTLTEDK